MFDGGVFMDRLAACPDYYHHIIQPCPVELIGVVEKTLGRLPQPLAEILNRFDGAELFIAGLPLVTFFRASACSPLPPVEWGQDWYVDCATAQWRAAGPGREGDWAFAMTSYGGLVIYGDSGVVKEWDIGNRRWISEALPFEQWIDKMMSDGVALMAE